MNVSIALNFMSLFGIRSLLVSFRLDFFIQVFVVRFGSCIFGQFLHMARCGSQTSPFLLHHFFPSAINNIRNKFAMDLEDYQPSELSIPFQAITKHLRDLIVNQLNAYGFLYLD